MRRLLPLLAIALIGAAPADEAPVATTASGTVRGTVADGVASFKGIPYAAPPVGPLRWHAPEPVQPWTAPRDAKGYGNDCMQARFAGDIANTTLPMREDCLFLNVWTPKPVSGAKLAVMVYIHGGGFSGGTGSSAILDGSRLAARGVVVVTLNYRLGRFGFFAHPALTREAAGGATGNWGLMDQIAALNWVKRNIAAFGGDPANVTIFGESAGGESVDRLMVSPAAKGLFAKAIAASGGGRDSWPTLAAAEAKGVAFAKQQGIAGDDLAALRKVPADRVQGGINLLKADEEHYSGPMTDGRIVTGDVDTLLAAGKARGIRYIVGSNSDELGFIPAMFMGGFVKKATEALGDGAEAVRAAYGSPDLYGYVVEDKRKSLSGASHASDVPFQFDNLMLAGGKVTRADMAAAKLVADYWVNFARTGDPNGPGLPAWPRFAATDGQMLAIGTDTKAAPAGGPALGAIAAARDAGKK
ncbi:MAG: carboxylesterase family protein [Sphingomonadales bacterium]|nr:carboxylesterase family protein [Sphingomonadales bacterium]